MGCTKSYHIRGPWRLLQSSVESDSGRSGHCRDLSSIGATRLHFQTDLRFHRATAHASAAEYTSSYILLTRPTQPKRGRLIESCAPS
jgi:hypothetical protein